MRKEFKEYLGFLIQIDKKEQEKRSVLVNFLKTFWQTKDIKEMKKLGEERKKKEENFTKETDELNKKLE